MDDLISRQSVIEMLTEIETNNWFPTFAMLKQRVSDIPTAYNVDKVVEQLEAEKNPFYREDGSLMCNRPNIRIDKAIEIVKVGGRGGN